MQAGYQGFLALALSNFADCYGDYTKKTAERLAPVAARVLKELSSGARTFVHGDYRADNLLFGPGLGEDGIVAVDWQISGRGGPLYDVAYLICNSVPTAYRQQAEKTLLRRYHDTLLHMGVRASASTTAGRPTVSPSCAACSSPSSRRAAWISATSGAGTWCAPWPIASMPR